LSKPVTPVALGVFFVFATLMTAAVTVTLQWPGGPLDAMWRVKPAAYSDLLLLRPASTIGFAALCATMAAAAFGAATRKRWGWWLALSIFALNGLGDALNAMGGALAEGAFGVAVTLLILWWLTRRRVRTLFG
jgi:hypothetical protein